MAAAPAGRLPVPHHPLHLPVPKHWIDSKMGDQASLREVVVRAPRPCALLDVRPLVSVLHHSLVIVEAAALLRRACHSCQVGVCLSWACLLSCAFWLRGGSSLVHCFAPFGANSSLSSAVLAKGNGVLICEPALPSYLALLDPAEFSTLSVRR